MTIHAEHSCIKKLERKNKFSCDVKSKDKIDLICIRLSKSCKIGYSRPCKSCIKRMNKCSFNIRYVYYSTSDNRIIREKFSDMDKSEDTILSSGDRKRAGITRELHNEYMKDTSIIPKAHQKFYSIS